MALTSNDASKRLLGRWWKRLHRVGLHTLAGFFFISYVLEATRDARFAGFVAFMVVLGLLRALAIPTVRARISKGRREARGT